MEIIETLEMKREKALNAYNKSIEEKEQLLAERKREIEKAISSITEKYIPNLKESEKRIQENRKEVDNYHELILKYSTFDSELIGHAIEKLIKIIEGEDFTFQIADYKVSYLEHNIWGQPYESVVRNKVQLIINMKKVQSEYAKHIDNESEVTRLIASGDAILLGEPKYYDINKVKFYDIKDNQIISLVNFGKFAYVKAFIDYIIEYRYENTVEELTETDLIKLLQEFINANKEIIIRNYFTRINSDIQILSRQK